MPAIWTDNVGKVSQLEVGTPGALIGVAASTGTSSSAIAFESHKSIITTLGVSEQSNAMFQHTIGDSIHVYTFGDRIGEMKVGGISFAADCLTDTFGPAEHGLARIRQFFHDNKVSVRASPLTVLVGSSNETIDGYLVGWNGNVVNSEHRVFEWSLTLAAIPKG